MIAMIFCGNIEFCPYVSKYSQILENNIVESKVLFWKRQEFYTEYPSQYCYFKFNSKLKKKRILKILDFFLFRKWLLKQISIGQYDKIIILDTLSGILLSNLLLSKFEGKYIFDIRDYSYENNKIFKSIEYKIIKASYATCISSSGFKNFLPKWNYIETHNCKFESRDNNLFFTKKCEGESLNIVYIGSIRYFKHQAKIIDRLANDSRFYMFYHGTGPDYDELVDYCKCNNIENILFTGQYREEDKETLLSNADVLLNSYDISAGNEVKYAISNKYYDGILYHIPQVVEVNTYKANLVEKEIVGWSLNANDKNFSNQLYQSYMNLSEANFNEKCKQLLKQYVNEDYKFISKVTQFVKS